MIASTIPVKVLSAQDRLSLSSLLEYQMYPRHQNGSTCLVCQVCNSVSCTYIGSVEYECKATTGNHLQLQLSVARRGHSRATVLDSADMVNPVQLIIPIISTAKFSNNRFGSNHERIENKLGIE